MSRIIVFVLLVCFGAVSILVETLIVPKIDSKKVRADKRVHGYSELIQLNNERINGLDAAFESVERIYSINRTDRSRVFDTASRRRVLDLYSDIYSVARFLHADCITLSLQKDMPYMYCDLYKKYDNPTILTRKFNYSSEHKIWGSMLIDLIAHNNYLIKLEQKDRELTKALSSKIDRFHAVTGLIAILLLIVNSFYLLFRK